MTELIYSNLNPYNASPLFQEASGRGVLINPPAFPMTSEELDLVYSLPYRRLSHPAYQGGVPALKVVEASITSHRGCYGACSFCSISLHQGKFIQSRSEKSIRGEAEKLAASGKKTITDVGGPSANMYASFCSDRSAMKNCRRQSCIFPNQCQHLKASQKDYSELLKNILSLKGIKNVFINSGVRYDLALLEESFIRDLARCFTPGQLSGAPEHVDDNILKLMGKPLIKVYDDFSAKFYSYSQKAGKSQHLMPYFIVGHPGADDKSENKIATYFRENKIRMRQIQEFYPTPMTISTSIYYTGQVPFTGELVKSEKKLSVIKKWKGKIL
ncbi:MAG: DUF3362 domain-containing protein [Elusimicrobia bacterium]|nr:DUF3362 domain-containing protein [Elusimicrobiota bacterium]